MYSAETSVKIYNDKTGDFIEVRPDPDSLGLLQIVQEDSNVCMNREEAVLVMQAIERVLKSNEDIIK